MKIGTQMKDLERSGGSSIVSVYFLKWKKVFDSIFGREGERLCVCDGNLIPKAPVSPIDLQLRQYDVMHTSPYLGSQGHNALT